MFSLNGELQRVDIPFLLNVAYMILYSLEAFDLDLILLFYLYASHASNNGLLWFYNLSMDAIFAFILLSVDSWN